MPCDPQPSTSGSSTSHLVVVTKRSAKRRLHAESDTGSDDSAVTSVSTDSEEPDEPDASGVVEVGTFVMIEFAQKKVTVYYVGQVVELNEVEVKVDFYRFCNGRFTKPELQDCKYVGRDQIALVLPPAISHGSTMRQLGGVTFPVNLKQYKMC